MIDASRIYTAKRAQNVLEEKDVEQIFDLYKNYVDVPEKCSIVNIDKIEELNYSLSVSRYVKRAEVPVKPIDEAYEEYVAAVNMCVGEEEKLERMLRKGGRLHE